MRISDWSSDVCSSDLEAFPLPHAALAATARAYRDARQWPTSLTLYREGMRRFPQDPLFTLGEIEVLADVGATAPALAQAQALVEKSPDNLQALPALSYASRRANPPYAPLSVAPRAFTSPPETPNP